MTHSRLDDCTVGIHPLVVGLLKGMLNERQFVFHYTSSSEITPVANKAP